MKRAQLFLAVIGSTLLLLAFLMSEGAFARYRLLSEDLAYEMLQTERLHGKDLNFSKVKIAIIDRGFPGINSSRIQDVIGAVHVVDTLTEEETARDNSKYLSDLTRAESEDGHGLAMLQLALASSGAWWVSDNRRPQIYLIPARGIQHYKKAADFILSEGIDIVIHSRNLEWSSNLDGAGFLNAQISRATSRGAIWLNSVGNTGGMTYTSRGLQLRSRPYIQKEFEALPEDEKDFYEDSHGILFLPNKDNTIIFENKATGNQVDITLSWNAFTDDHLDATDKDLDIKLYTVVDDYDNFSDNDSKFDKDGDGLIPVEGLGPFDGRRRQIGEHSSEEGKTGHAFEKISVALTMNRYALRVFARSSVKSVKSPHGILSTKNDRFRIVINSAQPGAVVVDNYADSDIQNEVTAPADNPDVVAVGLAGAPFSAKGKVRNGKYKPDVLLNLNPQSHYSTYESNSTAKTPLDTSEATAVLGGVVLAMKALDRRLNKESFFRYIEALPNEAAIETPSKIWETGFEEWPRDQGRIQRR